MYGFEANPLISAYAEQYVEYLNGVRAEEPKNCVPRSGSSKHLQEYANVYGCKGEQWRACMFNKLEQPLAALMDSLNPNLNSTLLLKERLDTAASCNGGHVNPQAWNHSRCNATFTFVPAAVAASDGWLSFDSSARQLIRGGSVAHNLGQASYMNRKNGFVRKHPQLKAQGAMAPVEYTVRTVDVVTWMASSFRTSDFVVLKMDVEGAEYSIFEKLAEIGKIDLIDVLSIETHPFGFTKSIPSAERLFDLFKREAPNMRVDEEETEHMISHRKGQHAGYDRFTTLPEAAAILAEAKRCGIQIGR